MSFRSVKYPRKRVSLDCGVSLTEQSHAKSCDVNRIVKRFQRDGIRMEKVPGYVDLSNAKFGDFSDGISYQEACNSVLMANESFMALPSELRRKFGNDPGEFLDFVSNPDNKDQLVDLGLLKPEVVTPDAADASGSPTATPLVGE